MLRKYSAVNRSPKIAKLLFSNTSSLQYLSSAPSQDRSLGWEPIALFLSFAFDLTKAKIVYGTQFCQYLLYDLLTSHILSHSLFFLLKNKSNNASVMHQITKKFSIVFM